MNTKVRKAFLVVLTVLVLLAIPTSVFAQTEYPPPTGWVNDFANILTVEQGKSLNDELIAFEQRTTIEIVVVTVTSLNGQSIENYTADLGNQWGVGKAEKDNGIIFLIAPNERKTMILPADGIVDQLPKSVTRNVIDQVVLTQFKEGNMQQGIINGTHAIMVALDNPPVSQAESVTSEVDAEQAFLAIVLVVGVFGALVGGLSYTQAKQLQKDVLQKQSNLIDRLKEAHKMAEKPDVKPASRRKLKSVNKDLAKTQRQILSAKKLDWQDMSNKLESISYDLEDAVFRFQEDIDRAKEARRLGPKLLKSLPAKIKAIKKRLGKGESSKQANRYLKLADRNYRRASTYYASVNNTSNINWLLLYLWLSSSNSQLSNANEAHTRANAAPGTYSDNSYSDSSRYDDNDSSSSHGYGPSGSLGGGGNFSPTNGSSGGW